MPQISLLSFDSEGQLRQDRKCTNCELHKESRLITNMMAGVGPTPADLMFVGYAPAYEDDQRGIPMTGKGGRVFRELLQAAGIDPQSVYITNALKCCPYDIEGDKKHFERCKTHLLKEIQAVKPKAIVSVGAAAFNWLTGQSGLRKYRQRGFLFKYNYEIYVYPIIQPAAIFHGDTGEKIRTKENIIQDLVWIKQKLEAGTLKEADEMEVDYKYAKSMADVYSFMEEFDNADLVSVDMENATVTGEGALFPEEGTIPVAFGFSTGPGHGRAIPLYAWSSLTQYYWRDDQVDEIIRLIKDRLQRKTIFGHNWLQYDQKWIRYFFSLDRTNVVFDTMLAHYLIDEDKGTHDLEQLAVRYTKMPTWKKTFTLRDTHGTCMYLCKDVDATFRVKEPIEKEMTRKQKNLLKTLLIPLGHELMEMEYRGVKINAENLDKLADIFQMRIAEERKALNEMDEVRAFELTENTEINPKSPYDIGIIMGEYLKLEPLYKTKDGKFGTSAYVLDHYKDIPFVRHIQQLRSLNKLYDSYVEGMRERLKRDGRIHTSYLIHGTRTGRLSSRDPNLQNIPGEGKVGSFIADGSLLKDMFSADEGYTFVEMDYSQIELRALAMYTNDPAWLEMFRSGYDAHSGTAALVFKVPVSEITEEKRRFSKTINFGVVYGMGEESLIYKFTSSGSTEAEARKFMSEHKKIFKRTWEWMDEEEAWVREHYNQETFFGRMRRYDWIDDHAIRQAYNYKIQSTASDFTLTALVRCAKALRELCVDGYPLLTVHDSIAFQVREEQAWEAAEIIKYIAENLNFPFMNVPIKADFKMGRNWGSLKKIDVDKRSFK